MEEGDEAVPCTDPSLLIHDFTDWGIVAWLPRVLPASVVAVVVTDAQSGERAIAINTRIPGRMVAAALRHAAGHAALAGCLVTICQLGVCFGADAVLPWAAVLP